MRVAIGLVISMLLASVPAAIAGSNSADEVSWPGDPIDSHIHMTWAAMTLEVNDGLMSIPKLLT